MNWTKTPPTRAGAYWYKSPFNPNSIELVERTDDGNFFRCGRIGLLVNPAPASGEWSGPLVQVEEVRTAFWEAIELQGWQVPSVAACWKRSRARRVVEGRKCEH